jgi:hypothetical protein
MDGALRLVIAVSDRGPMYLLHETYTLLPTYVMYPKRFRNVLDEKP